MPLRDFKCPKGHVTERLLKMSDDRTQVDCQSCSQTAYLMVSLIASTSLRWGDCTGKFGVNGHYDRGLGATYHNSMEREALMKAKGLVTWEEAGGDASYDSYKQNHLEKQLGADAYLETFDEAVADGASLIKAHDLGLEARSNVDVSITSITD